VDETYRNLPQQSPTLIYTTKEQWCPSTTGHSEDDAAHNMRVAAHVAVQLCLPEKIVIIINDDNYQSRPTQQNLHSYTQNCPMTSSILSVGQS